MSPAREQHATTSKPFWLQQRNKLEAKEPLEMATRTLLVSDHGRRFSHTCRCTSSGLLHPCASSHSCISRARARTRPLAEARTTLDLASTTMTHSQKHVSGATRAQMAAAQVLRRAKSVVENVVALGNAVETTYASRFDAFLTTQRLLLRPTLMGRRRQPPPLPSTLWLLESRSV